MTTRPRLLTGAALAACALAFASAGPASAASGASERRAATRILGGTMWTTYQSGNVTGASQDRVAHLCRDGRFVVITNFVAAIIDDPSSYDHPYGESRVTGRWRVAKARLSPDRRRGRVVVRYVTDQGERGSVVFAATARGTTVAGLPAEVGRSNLC